MSTSMDLDDVSSLGHSQTMDLYMTFDPETKTNHTAIANTQQGHQNPAQVSWQFCGKDDVTENYSDQDLKQLETCLTRSMRFSYTMFFSMAKELGVKEINSLLARGPLTLSSIHPSELKLVKNTLNDFRAKKFVSTLQHLPALRLLFVLAVYGDMNCAYELGKCFDVGYGVHIDQEKAFNLYLMAGLMGHPPALFNVACCYDLGEGVQANKQTAYEFYCRSAKLGNLSGMFNQAASLELGEGVPKNTYKALQVYKVIAETKQDIDVKDRNMALFRVGLILTSQKQFSTIMTIVDRLRKFNDPRSYVLEGRYWEGQGTDSGMKRAFRCYLEAGNRGYGFAFKKVSLFYKYGFTGCQDPQKAQHYKNLADEWDCEDKLGRMHL